MHHVLAFSESQGIGATNDQLAAVADDVYNRQNNAFQLPTPLELLLTYSGGVGLDRPRINTASLRLRGFPQLAPFQVVLLPGTDPNVMDARDNPIPLRALEDFRVDTTNTDAGVQQHTIVAFVSNPNLVLNVARPDLRWIRWTASVTAVANAWSNLGTLTFEDTLEAGVYGIYGLAAVGAAIVAARLQLQNQLFRPGCLGMASVGLRSHQAFRGGLGKWGEFNTYSVPQIQTLETGAGASTPSGHLMVSKIA